MKLTWLGHSCFKIESREGSAVLDPYAPGYVPGLKLPEDLTADACFCSHDHGDHNCAAAVTLTGNMPEFKVSFLDCWHDEKHGALRGKNRITVIDAEGYRLVHMGDLGHEPEQEMIDALGKVDVLMLPVGGYYTIDAAAARRVAARIVPKITVPMHYKSPAFGFDVLDEVEAYLSLADNVIYLDTDTLTLPMNADGVTAVLSIKM